MAGAWAESGDGLRSLRLLGVIMALIDVRRCLQPPARPKDAGSPPPWAAAEAALGISYPRDFQQFITIYGSGTIGGVIEVLNPMAVDWSDAAAFETLPHSLDAVLATVSPFGNARETWLYGLASTLAAFNGGESRMLNVRGIPVPARPWPERPGLFPWGRGDDGQALLWWTDGDPEQWPVVLADPSEGLRAYSMDMTGLLAGWLSGSVTLDYLPRASRPYFSQDI